MSARARLAPPVTHEREDEADDHRVGARRNDCRRRRTVAREGRSHGTGGRSDGQQLACRGVHEQSPGDHDHGTEDRPRGQDREQADREDENGACASARAAIVAARRSGGTAATESRAEYGASSDADAAAISHARPPTHSAHVIRSPNSPFHSSARPPRGHRRSSAPECRTRASRRSGGRRGARARARPRRSLRRWLHG